MDWRRFFSRGGPRLDWIQVEVTTRCNSRCGYCPRAAWRDRWVERDLPMGLLRELKPAMVGTGLVHLQGWGEPLLHPELPEMVRLAHRAGCRVSTTSNGLLLGREMMERLLEAGLDVMGFSLAGASPATNDRWRPGTPFDAVLRAISVAAEARRRLDRPDFRIHLAYMLLRSGLGELERIPELAASAGVDQVVVSSLSLVPRDELLPEAVLVRTPEERERLAGRIHEVSEAGAAAGVEILFQLVAPDASPGRCPENVTRSVFITADGTIHPCVFLGLPVEAPEGPVTEGGAVDPPEPLVFGSVAGSSLEDVWWGDLHRGFRRAHRWGRLPAACGGCLKRRPLRLEEAAATGLVPEL